MTFRQTLCCSCNGSKIYRISHVSSYVYYVCGVLCTFSEKVISLGDVSWSFSNRNCIATHSQFYSIFYVSIEDNSESQKAWTKTVYERPLTASYRKVAVTSFCCKAHYNRRTQMVGYAQTSSITENFQQSIV